MEIVDVTLNPNDKEKVSLSNNNLSVKGDANSGAVAVRATHGRITGKWYWEFDNPYVAIGITNKNYPITSNITTGTTGDAQNLRLVNLVSQKLYPENTSYGSRAVASSIVGVALDLDSGTMEFYSNGISQGFSHTNLAEMGEVYPTLKMISYQIDRLTTVNFGATPFKYEIPHGFYSYDGRQNGWYNKFLILSENGDIVSAETVLSATDDFIPSMTSNTSELGKAICGSFYTDSYQAYKAFDKLTSTNAANSWTATEKSGWIGFDFVQPVIVNNYTITGRADTNYLMSPYTWTFEGSSDGVSWDVLDTRSNIDDWNLNQTKKFEFKNNRLYKMYRLNGANNHLTERLQVTELMMGIPNQGRYRLLDTLDENTFIDYGIEKGASLDMQTSFPYKECITTSQTTLGSGKVFKKQVDLTKREINKIILG